MRAGDQHIIETMLKRAMCIVLKRVAYLSGGALPIGIGVSFSGVIAPARFSGRRTIGYGVKGPVGDIDTHYRIDQAAFLQGVGGNPAFAQPSFNNIEHLRTIIFEWQQDLRTHQCLNLIVVNQLWRRTEFAILSDATGIEERNCLATLTLDRAPFSFPASQFLRQFT